MLTEKLHAVSLVGGSQSMPCLESGNETELLEGRSHQLGQTLPRRCLGA